MLTFRLTAFLILTVILLISMTHKNNSSPYLDLYSSRIEKFQAEQRSLIDLIQGAREISGDTIALVKRQIAATRLELKLIDFWLRYLEPVAYKKINGPLPVEWE